jgi:hypothetical protein
MTNRNLPAEALLSRQAIFDAASQGMGYWDERFEF